jgi:uncharacterized protein YjbI with pentapeptide repeats
MARQTAGVSSVTGRPVARGRLEKQARCVVGAVRSLGGRLLKEALGVVGLRKRMVASRLVASAVTRRRREGLLLCLAGAVSVSSAVLVGTFTGVGSAIAAATGVLVALASAGWLLWRAGPNRQEAKSSLGTGLLVSVVVAAAVGSAQFSIDDRRRLIESERAAETRNAASDHAEIQSLRITVGLRTELKGIQLSGRNLKAFYLAGKHLQNANFIGAVLAEANLDGARLRYARFINADLSNATLLKANLRQADLRSATLSEASLSEAILTDTDLRGATLRKTKLSSASLDGANLRRTDFQGAVLIKADLRNADLRQANLHGATLIAANLRGACFDSHTRWPDGFDPDAAGATSSTVRCELR